MSNDNKNTERLSMRKSILIWIGGICLGWGIASSLILAYWAMSRQEPIQDVSVAGQPMTASADTDAKGLNEVMPAAGTAAKGKK
jgi:hypothetical protein